MYPKDIIERIKLPFRKDKELYSSFYKILGFYPHHIQYYEQALHHKSSSIKKQGSWINNERLEFLGDAILDASWGTLSSATSKVNVKVFSLTPAVKSYNVKH